MQLTELKEDIFQRWVAAFGEIDKIAEAKAAAVRYLYARRKCYDVENYDGQQIVPDEEVFSESSEDTGYKYGLDKEGRPCYLSYEHQYMKEQWEACFIYTEQEAIYLEFYTNEQTLVAIQRKHMEDRSAKAYQFLRINAGQLKTLFSKYTPEALIKKLEKDKSILLQVQRYRHEQDRIIAADCLSVMSGVGETIFERQYNYNQIGVLQDTVDKYDNWPDQYRYVLFPEDKTLQEVADEISVLMAKAIVDGLLEAEVDEPLSMLEINYRHISSYHPYVMVLTAAEQEEQLAELEKEEVFEIFLNSAKTDIPVSSDSFQRLLIAFTSKAMNAYEYEMARSMMRNTAKLLTTQKLSGKIPVSDHFIAYAVDWSMDEQDLAGLLKDCGMSDEMIDWWRSRGLFMYDE